jgi:hypothetical protein
MPSLSHRVGLSRRLDSFNEIGTWGSVCRVRKVSSIKVLAEMQATMLARCDQKPLRIDLIYQTLLPPEISGSRGSVI